MSADMTRLRPGRPCACGRGRPWHLRGWTGCPTLRNLVGLHSPSAAFLGWCTCRRCRR